MNHRLDRRLRNLEEKQAAERDCDREIRITWVTANSSRGRGLWQESELAPEERTSRYSLVAQPPPLGAVESAKNDIGPTGSAEEEEQEEQ